MTDIQDPRLLWAKATLFIFLGVISAACAYTLGFETPGQFILFWGLSVWSCCRAYYFAFYAIEKYVDPSFKYAGILSMIEYLLGSKQSEVADSAKDAADDVQETYVAKNGYKRWIVRLMVMLFACIVTVLVAEVVLREWSFEATLVILLALSLAIFFFPNLFFLFLNSAMRAPTSKAMLDDNRAFFFAFSASLAVFLLPLRRCGARLQFVKRKE